MDRSDITIRPARPDDLHLIGRLGASLVRLHHGFDPKRFIAATAESEHMYASFIRSQLDEPNAVVLVAERAGEAIGYTSRPPNRTRPRSSCSRARDSGGR